MRILLALLLLLLVMLAPGAGAARATSPYAMEDTNDRLTLYLEADTTTTGAHLSRLPEGPSTSFQGGDPASGASGTAATFSSAKPPPIIFTAKQSLGQDHFLNLSKPVVGALFWQSTHSGAASRDAAAIVVEVWAGTKLVGGDSFAYVPSTAYGPWIPMYFRFRPEVAALESGQTLSVKVFRPTALADFRIALDGKEQSFVEFHYFEKDPLKGLVYLENGRMFASDRPPESEPGAAGMALLGAPLALLSRKRPRRLLLAAALVFGAAFAGCLGGPSATTIGADGGTAPAAPTANVTQQDEAKLVEAGAGAIQGTIVNGEAGVAIARAHVALVGTSLFTSSDGSGAFVFEEVAANTYTLRVDATGYQTLEHSITVAIGKRVWVNITLYKRVIGNAAENPHTHDLWGSDMAKTIMDAPVMPRSYQDAPPVANMWFTLYLCDCETRITLPEEALVLPGTSRVEVTFQWSSSTAGPRELGLRITTAGDTSGDQYFVGRPTGTPFNIPIFPTEADPGHQAGTAWTLWVRHPGYEPHTQVPNGANAAGGAVQVKVRIHKGVIPLEAPHRTFWNGASEVDVFKASVVVGATICCGNFHWPGDRVWTPAAGVFVPPGTASIRGELSWTQNQNAPAGLDWALAYRSADMVGADAWKSVPYQPAGTNKITFDMPLAAGMPDQYYQRVSFWKFSPDDKVSTTPLVNPGYNVRWVLTVTAVRDPTYVE